MTLDQATKLVQDPVEGKYPTDTPHRREVLQSLRYAEQIWTPKRTWASIRKRDVRALARRRIAELVEEGKRGARTAEKMIEHLVSVANWLRDNEHIAEAACIPSSKWSQELYDDWRAMTESDEDYQVQKPRHSLAEARAILQKAAEIDPRFHLLLALGADLRLGQVVRARRSQLNLEDDTFTVYGRGKKRGTTIELTAGQRRAVGYALQGYLRTFEASCADYPLFPGRYATKKGIFTKSDASYLHKQTLYRWFRRAEELAGVPHVAGRCAYGIRRVAVDELLGDGVSLMALTNNGGWSNPAIPTQEYADQQNRSARQEAARARAKWRGEAAEPVPESPEL
jgi:integrase